MKKITQMCPLSNNEDCKDPDRCALNVDREKIFQSVERSRFGPFHLFFNSVEASI